MRMYLYETSRNIQEPWPHDLYIVFHSLLTSDFGLFSMVDIFVIGRFLSSVDGSKLIFTRDFTTVRPAGSAVIPRVRALGWG